MNVRFETGRSPMGLHQFFFRRGVIIAERWLVGSKPSLSDALHIFVTVVYVAVSLRTASIFLWQNLENLEPSGYC